MPRIVVYTAIFDDYDQLPIVQAVDNNIDHVSITDRVDTHGRLPLKTRHAPRIFKDPIMDARRAKILPHLLFPDADLTVWIDARAGREIDSLSSSSPIDGLALN